MVKGKRKKAASKQHAMDTEGGQEDGGAGAWQSGVSAETGEDLIGMDTGDFGEKAKAQHPKLKVQQGKRGNRTRAQKRRKSGALEKALAFAGRLEGKAGKAGSATAVRKQAKGLWSKDEDAF